MPSPLILARAKRFGGNSGGNGMIALPPFVQWIQAISQALTVPAIAAIGVVIAWRQASLTRIKLQHDLYDRRFAIFNAARRFLSIIARDARVNSDGLREFSLGTADAVFLTNRTIAAYLEEIRRRAIEVQILSAELEGEPVGPERSGLVQKRSEHLRWLRDQLEKDDLVERFRPLLTLDPKSAEQ
jgi:hypothetical protein